MIRFQSFWVINILGSKYMYIDCTKGRGLRTVTTKQGRLTHRCVNRRMKCESKAYPNRTLKLDPGVRLSRAKSYRGVGLSRSPFLTLHRGSLCICSSVRYQLVGTFICRTNIISPKQIMLTFNKTTYL